MTNFHDAINLINPQTEFIQDGENVVRKHTQEIPQWHLDALAQQRNESKNKPEGEFMRVASIPTVIVEKWMREGFNIWEVDGKEIVKRLKAENLDAFLTTEKSI
jgi:hypothetical protein